MSSSPDSWLEERRGCHRIVGAYLYESWGQVLPDRSWRQAWNSLEFTASRTLVEFLQNHDSQAREKELFSLLALFRSTYLVLTFASTSKPFSSLQGLRASAGVLPGETFLRKMRMTFWRPDWGGASGVSTAWRRAIATDICYKTVRQLWIEEHDVELQSTMRLIAAEDRRKRRMLRESCPDSSDSD